MAEREGMALWPFVVAFLVAVGGVCAALFWPDPATSLRVYNPQHNSAGSALANIPLRTPYVFAPFPVCVAHGSVTIDHVDLRAPHAGIEVVDWAVAKKPGNYNEVGTPGRAGKLAGFSGHAVSAACSAPRFLAVSVQRTAGTSYTNGFEVRSTSGSVVLPHAVKLCASACASGIDYSGTP